MSEFLGTKGKWYWYHYGTNKMASLMSESGGEVCNFGSCETYYPTEGDEPNDADKLLIAHAPEMLEMLQYFVRENMLSIAGEEMAEQLIQKATTLCETK